MEAQAVEEARQAAAATALARAEVAAAVAAAEEERAALIKQVNPHTTALQTHTCTRAA